MFPLVYSAFFVVSLYYISHYFVHDLDASVKFERSVYNVKENSQGKVRLVLSEIPKFTFSVTITQEDGTATGQFITCNVKYHLRNDFIHCKIWILLCITDSYE